MKFAFVVHPVSESHKMFRLDDGGEFRKLWNGGSAIAISDYLQAWMAANANRRQGLSDVVVVDEMLNLYSKNGTSTEGRLYQVPMLASEIKDDTTAAMEYIERAVDMAADWGAEIIGLGSMTGIVGGQGQYIADRSRVAITTGNSLTVFSALENLSRVCEELGIDLLGETVAIVGIPGSIATAAARMLARHVGRLILVARRKNRRAEEVAQRLDAELLYDIPTALSRTHIVLSATSTGACIEQRDLRSGSIVIDVGVPADVRGRQAEREDVLIVSGGLARIPEAMSRDCIFLGFYYGIVPSCLAETMNLALEGRAENYSLGRDLEPAKIRSIGKSAQLNGFDFSQVFSFGLPVENSAWSDILKVDTRRRIERNVQEAEGSSRSHRGEIGCGVSNPQNGNGASDQEKSDGHGIPLERAALPPIAKLAARAEDLFARYINPVLVGVGTDGGLTATFVRGEGCLLWDDKGKKYLDFVSGFGSVNIGHNHPRVVEAVNEALTRQVPGFAQSAINPYAAALAERLVAVTPPNLDMVFFCNSGSEAVEAALKLVRATSDRSSFLHCEGSFHGKTIGSLSVTGNRGYQRPFEPLVPGTESVPYGDIESLRLALNSRRFAGFIVEPIQGEGGMTPPPAGYLKEAESLCRATDTLLIVDEVQTGLGRTGKLFACDESGVEPDILCLAKSLSGGMIPIAAMLARRTLHQKAYGTLDTFALHTSTFGGGSYACAAGLAALEVIVDERLAENALARGRQLRRGLREIQSDLPEYIDDVRGPGLMIGVELSPLKALVAKHLKRADVTGMLQHLVGGLDELMKTLPAVFQMQMLLQQHGIYTQVTRSNPLVLRVQPPLSITETQVDQFLGAFAQTCRAGQNVEDLFDVLISKATTGHHGADQQSPRKPEQSPGDQKTSQGVVRPL